jgi:hypothetical protein
VPLAVAQDDLRARQLKAVRRLLTRLNTELFASPRRASDSALDQGTCPDRNGGSGLRCLGVIAVYRYETVFVQNL